MEKNNLESKKKKVVFFILIALTIYVSLPIFTPYLIPGIDLQFHLFRIEGIVAGIKTGQLPVRMQPEWLKGYGYPVSIFYSDFFLYVAAIFRVLGMSLQNAYKIYVFIINLISVFVSYISFKEFFEDDVLIGGIGSLLWTTSIYRLGCEYARAGVGEYTALAFIPLCFLGVYQLLYEPEKKSGWIKTGVSYACIILSHMLTAELTAIGIIFITLVNYRKICKKEYLFPIIKSIVLCFALSIWFLLPFINILGKMNFQFQNKEGIELIQTQGASIMQLLLPFNRANGMISSVSVVDGLRMTKELPYSIGIAGWCILVVFVVLWIWDKNNQHIKQSRLLFWGVVIILFMASYYFPWDYIALSNKFCYSMICLLQFPWRLLGFANFILVLLAGKTINALKDNYKLTFIAFLIGFSVLNAGIFIVDRDFGTEYWNILSKDDLNSMNIMGGEYVPEGLDLGITEDHEILHSSNVILKESDRYYTNFNIDCENVSGKDEVIVFPLLYYPYYHAKSNGEELSIECMNKGQLGVRLPRNFDGNIKITIKEPLIFLFASMISVIAWGYSIITILKNYKNRYKLNI